MWLGTIWHNDCIQGCLWKLQRKMQEKKIALIFFLVNHSGVKSFKSPTGGSVRELGILPKMPFSFGNASECAGYDYSHFRDLCNKNDFPNKKRGHIFVMWWFLFLPALFRTGDFYMVKKPIPSVWYIYIYIVHLNFPEKSSKCRKRMVVGNSKPSTTLGGFPPSGRVEALRWQHLDTEQLRKACELRHFDFIGVQGLHRGCFGVPRSWGFKKRYLQKKRKSKAKLERMNVWKIGSSKSIKRANCT